MASRDQSVFLIGTLPFLLIIGAFIVMGVFFFFVQLTAADITELLIAMGTIWLVVMLVLIFVTQVCMAISPRENFASDQETPVQKVFDDFNNTETTVCTMIGNVVEFIKNKVGKKGEDDPSLYTQAINDAIGKVDGPITSCPAGGTPTSVDDVNDRLSRMQDTLDQFIRPVLKDTYDITFDQKGCDNFVGNLLVEPFDDTQEEVGMIMSGLPAIQNTIASLTGQYLGPIQQKQKDLKSGKASDCDKKKGAKKANSSSLSMIEGSSSGKQGI